MVNSFAGDVESCMNPVYEGRISRTSSCCVKYEGERGRGSTLVVFILKVLTSDTPTPFRNISSIALPTTPGFLVTYPTYDKRLKESRNGRYDPNIKETTGTHRNTNQDWLRTPVCTGHSENPVS